MITGVCSFLDYLDTVGVAGSIPVEPTIKKPGKPLQRRLFPGSFNQTLNSTIPNYPSPDRATRARRCGEIAVIAGGARG